MSTKNFHYFPVNLALTLIFGTLCAMPFSALYIFGTNKPQTVLGTKSSIVENVTLNQQANINVTEFSYSLSPFEEKQIQTLGTKVYLKQVYQGVEFNIVNGNLIIKNLTPNSYLIDGVVY